MSPPPFVNSMQARVNVKMCLSMMVRVHTNSSPSYVSSLVTPCSSLQSRRALRSSSQADYVVTRSLTKFGNRAFVYAAPGWTYQAAGLHSHHYHRVKLTSRHTCSKFIRTTLSYVTRFVHDAFCFGMLQMSVL